MVNFELTHFLTSECNSGVNSEKKERFLPLIVTQYNRLPQHFWPRFSGPLEKRDMATPLLTLCVGWQYITRGKYSNRPAWACFFKSDYMVHIINKMWSFCSLILLTHCTSEFQLQRMQAIKHNQTL